MQRAMKMVNRIYCAVLLKLLSRKKSRLDEESYLNKNVMIIFSVSRAEPVSHCQKKRQGLDEKGTYNAMASIYSNDFSNFSCKRLLAIFLYKSIL